MLLWLGFILCTAVIVFSGSRLSRYGDIIAEKSGLGRAWTGVVLMATVTSLPELFTGISSVMIIGVPEIAVGDVVGSCAFNMLILAMLDTFCRPVPVTSRAHQGNILSAGFGILLLSMLAQSLLIEDDAPAVGWIGAYTLLFLMVYLLAVRLVYLFERRRISEFVQELAEEPPYGGISMRTAVAGYCINALIVTVAALFIPYFGKGIAQLTGLSRSFIGTALVAASTSLPEIVTSVAAIRMNAVDLAIGNLFGSNLFNILVLALDDILYTQGPILSFAGKGHIVSAISAISMTAVAITGLIYRAEKKRLWLAWDAIGIIAIYVVMMIKYPKG